MNSVLNRTPKTINYNYNNILQEY